MSRRWVVECYNTITETTSRELQEHTSPVTAQARADYMNQLHGSVPGDMYAVVEIDEKGNTVTPGYTEPTTGDSGLDALIMGSREDEQQ